MSDYLLWGKECNGESAGANGNIELEGKNKTWAKREVASLDELFETAENPETISALIHPLDAVLPPFKRREVFSREKALQTSNESIRASFEALFN